MIIKNKHDGQDIFSCCCSHCLVLFEHFNEGFTFYWNRDNLTDAMDSQDWYTTGRKEHICPECYRTDENDKIILPIERKDLHLQ